MDNFTKIYQAMTTSQLKAALRVANRRLSKLEPWRKAAIEKTAQRLGAIDAILIMRGENG